MLLFEIWMIIIIPDKFHFFEIKIEGKPLILFIDLILKSNQYQI